MFLRGCVDRCKAGNTVCSQAINEGMFESKMAQQTRTQRQAAAKKAAATRKRQSASQSNGNAKAAARRTAKSARSSANSARTTSRNGALTAARRLSAERFRLEAVGRQAERVVLIPVGAALEARDRLAAVVPDLRGPRARAQAAQPFRAARRHRAAEKPPCGRAPCQGRSERGGDPCERRPGSRK